MDIKLGPRIESLRRAKSKTQEQLLLSANGRQGFHLDKDTTPQLTLTLL